MGLCMAVYKAMRFYSIMLVHIFLKCLRDSGGGVGCRDTGIAFLSTAVPFFVAKIYHFFVGVSSYFTLSSLHSSYVQSLS